MAENQDFQGRVQKIAGLVHDLESIADPAARAAAKELVQLLMDMHGSGLERILETIFRSGESGARLIDELGQDPLVSSLLVLYGLHPDDLQTRVERKLKQIVSKLHKMGAAANLIAVHEGNVRVRVVVHGHSCGSTTSAVRAAVEDAIYEAAPDLNSLLVEGLDEPAASGFVALEKLRGSPVEPQATHQQLSITAEGMH